MKLIILCGLIVAAVADGLDNAYLPPSNARTAGGNGNVLSTPLGSSSRSGFGQDNGATSKNYLPPTSGSSGFARVEHNGGLASNFRQKSNNFGVSSGFGPQGSGPSGAFGSNSGFAQKSSFGSSGSFGSAGSFGSSNARFGQKPSGSFGTSGFGSNSRVSGKTSGNIGSTVFRQTPSPQYGAPSSVYGVPSGSAARYGGSQSRDAGAAILRSNNENFGDGSYRFNYETENKISHNEAGELKNAGSDYEAASVQGSYTYTGDDGKSYQVNYIADENGFQPTGDHLPTSPPIPEAIQRSLIKNSQQEGSFGHQSRFQGNSGFQSANRQYLAPNKPSFNTQTGYQY